MTEGWEMSCPEGSMDRLHGYPKGQPQMMRLRHPIRLVHLEIHRCLSLFRKSVTAQASCSGASLPREREASLFVLVNPLPIVLLPQMPLEACHAPPLPNV